MADKEVKDLVVRLSLQNDKLKKELKETNKAFKKTSTEQGKLGNSISGLKTGFVLLAGVITGVVGTAFKKVTGLARDFEEANAKFGVVFRGTSREANDMRKELVNSYGLSTLAATNMLASIQDFLVPMGIAREEATDLSGSFVKLARDVGSFNNAPTPQVLDAIKSALSGMSMPLKQFGVDVSQTGLQQQLMNEGISESVQELTRAEKAQLIYRKIVADSSDAIGDFARTSDSFANSLVSIEAIAQDVQLAIGQELLKEIGPTITEFSKFLKSAEGVESINKALKGVFIILRLIKLNTQFVKSLFVDSWLIPSIALVKGLGSALEAIKNRDLKGFREAMGELTDETIEKFKDSGLAIKDTTVDILKESLKLIQDTDKAIISGTETIVDETEKRNKTIIKKKQLAAKQVKEIDKLTRKEQFLDEDEKLQFKIDKLNKYLNEYELSSDQILAITEARTELQKELDESLLNERLDNLKEFLSQASDISEAAFDLIVQLNKNKLNEMSIDENEFTREMMRLSGLAKAKKINDLIEERDKAIAANDDELADEKQKDIDMAILENNAAVRERMIKFQAAVHGYKIAKFEKATSLFSAIVNTAQAVTKALTLPFPASLVAAGLIGGLGAAEVGTIAATPLPEIPAFERGGLIGGNRHINGGTVIEAERGESILNREATAILGTEAINALNDGRDISNNVNITVNTDNGQEVVDVLNDYFKQFGTSERGVSV